MSDWATQLGLKALKAVQDQESLLWKVSEALTAPVDKLDKTAEKIVKELKEANVEKRQLNQRARRKRKHSWTSTNIAKLQQKSTE